MIASIFSYLKKRLVYVLGILAVIILIVFLVKNAGGNKQGDGSGEDVAGSAEISVVETTEVSEPDEINQPEESPEGENAGGSEDEAQNETDDKAVALESVEESSSDSASASESSASDESAKTAIGDKVSDDSTALESVKDSADKKAESKISESTPAKEFPSEIDIDSFSRDFPEAVAWLWFEDGSISYPVMQASDNTKYKSVDYTGADARTGSIFMDYRSSSDFSDPNTIIYGHNMSDGSMFGAFKNYKYNPSFLKGHEYFQIITKDGIQRYRIFAFMDLPKSSALYNICGPDNNKMKTLTDYLEVRTYVDSGIEAKEDDQLIMLSTCTDKDDLYFVVFGMVVD